MDKQARNQKKNKSGDTEVDRLKSVDRRKSVGVPCTKRWGRHLDRASECAQRQAETETKEGELLRISRGEKCLSFTARPVPDSGSFPADTARAKGWPCLQVIPHPLCHTGCWPQAPFFQNTFLPSSSLLTSYVASWLGSGSCCGTRAVLSSSVNVSSFPASVSIRFSSAWCELLRPSCKSHSIMCIWAESGTEVSGGWDIPPYPIE